MGLWAEHEFGVTTLPQRAYLFAGPSSREKIDVIIRSLGEVLFHRHDVYERYLVKGVGSEAIVMFQLYGSPILCDLVTILKDGNVKEAIFFGYAYGMGKSMNIGDCIVPSKVQTLDGVTNKLGSLSYTTPDKELVEMISRILQENQFPFKQGKSVSVPATFWHGDEGLIDTDAIALELEFAAFCYCCQVSGIKAGGVLVIGDTRQQGLLDKRISPDPKMLKVFRVIRENWKQ